MKDFSPNLVCFSCSFGWGYLVGREQLAAAVNNLVPVTCSGKVDAIHVLRAFREGADGVLILGCPEGECHFQDGNYQVRKRMALLQKVLKANGVDPQRLAMAFAVDPEGSRISELIENMRGKLSELGPATSY